jgi:hypothetical protein
MMIHFTLFVYGHINAKKQMDERNGTQAGDPPNGAKAMYEFAITKDPPLRAVIGTDVNGYKAPS